MKKFSFFLVVPVFAFVSCHNPDKQQKKSSDSAGDFVVRYPLPKSTDSLYDILKKIPDDTNKVNVLSAIGQKKMYGNPDTCIIIFNKVLEISEKTNFGKGVARGYGTIGLCHYLKGEYPEALEFLQKALKVDEESGNKQGMVSRLSNMGLVYTGQGDFQKGMESYLKALKIAEAEDDKNYMAAVLGNLGILNEQQKNYDKALEYELRALKLYEGLDNKTGRAANLGNIGVVYLDKSELSLSLPYFKSYIKLAEEIGNKGYQGTGFDNIGKVYSDSAKKVTGIVERDSLYNKALNFYFQAIKIDQETGSRYSLVNVFGNTGHVYFSQGKYEKAHEYFFRALAISDSMGTSNLSQKVYELISLLYEKSTVSLPDSTNGKKLGMEEMRLSALHYYKSAVNLKDTLFSQENRKELLRKELNYDFEKKESEIKAQQDKKDLIAQAELKQKERERNYFIAGFGMVMLLALFIFKGYRQKQKANEIISNQKITLEEKQKEILDSIHYAKRIQTSLLPTEKYIERNLNRLKRK